MNKNYEVEISEDGDDTWLSITHNGRHWTSIPIHDAEREIPKIIEALQAKLDDD